MKMFKRTLAMLLCLVMALGLMAMGVSAADATTIDANAKGSITITKYESDTENDPSDGTNVDPDIPDDAELLEDVTFTLFQVMNSADTIAYYNGTSTNTVDVSTYVENGELKSGVTAITTTTAKTDENGEATFSDLPVGMYVVKETAYPDKVTKASDPFLVSIPMTNPENNAWMYDVYAYPKNSTSEGTVTLHKEDIAGNNLQGVVFKLEKQSGNTWNVEGSNRTTNSSGDIPYTNLSWGTYRLTEVSAPDGYIVDDRPITFTIEKDGDITCTDTRITTVSTETDPSGLTITLKNEDPGHTKTATTDVTNAGVGSTVSYELTADIPLLIADMKTFTLTDAPDNLVVDTSTIVVKVDGTDLTTGYSATENGNGFILAFTPADLAAYAGKDVVITYDATVLEGAATAGVAANTVTFKYSDKITTDSTHEENQVEKVYNFTIDITKYKDSVAEGNKIGGVEFELYSDSALTQKITVSGSNGVYTVNPTGNATLTTASDGGLTVKGLDAGTYYLKETKTIEGYNLLSGAVEINLNVSVTENADGSVTYKVGNVALADNSVDQNIVNKAGFTLPKTGGLGTLMFILIGGVLMAGGVVLLTSTGKKRAQ